MRRFLAFLLLVTACAQPLTAIAPVDSQLPGMLSGQHAWNGTSFTQNLWTDGDVQYAVWVDDERHPIIGARSLDGTWATFDLADVPGNPLASPIALDNHNVLAVATDPAGHIHVSGNMHSDELRYVRSVRSGDITAWTAPGMVGAQETSVTYPQFVLADDELLFFFRLGGASSSRTNVNAYDHHSQTWERRAYLINGKATGEATYLNRVGVGNDGTIHVMMMWRHHGPTTNNDISYARSVDGARTWTDSQGNPYTLPITHPAVEIVVNTPDKSSGLLNASGLAVDGEGNPHGAFLMDDHRGVTQVYHVYHDGRVWHWKSLTNLVLDLNLNAYAAERYVSRPSVFFDGSSVWVLYWAGDGDKPLRAINVTTGAEVVVLGGGFGDWEPTYDPHAPAGELAMLVSEVSADGTGPTTTPGRVFSVRLDD